MREPAANLLGIYQIFKDKSYEVLQFYYWTDEFYKGATREYEEHSIEESGKFDQILANLQDSTLLKDVKELEERSRERLRSTISQLHSKPDLLLKLCLVYVVGLFDAFFTDSAEILLDEQRFKEFKRLPFKKRILFLSDDFKVDVDSWDSTIVQIDEVFARRNLLLHCGGIVDSKYVERVPFYIFDEGAEVDVDEHYFTSATYDLRDLADYLYAVFKDAEGPN